MDKYQKYKQLAVKIKCRGEIGSGCLFQPSTHDYTYVFTAKHCLIGKAGENKDINIEEIEITQIKEAEEVVLIHALDFYFHSKLDLALIKVEYVEGLSYVFCNKVIGGEISCYGYPVSLENQERKMQKILGSVIDVDDEVLEFASNINLSDYYRSEIENVVGLSGSGVFIEAQNDLILVGILSRFKGENGTFQTLCALNILCYNELLQNNSLPPLVPRCLCNFDEYIGSAFEHHDENIGAVLKVKASMVRGTSPWSIYQRLREKLFLPYGQRSLIDANLWYGWITLLTYLSIESGNCEAGQNNLCRLKTGEVQQIKFYYSYTFKRLEQVVKYLFTEGPTEDIKRNDCIVINHNGSTGQTLYLSRQRIERIVKDIGSANLYPRGIYIDKPGFSKNISCLYLDYFARRFENCESGEASSTLEAELKKIITEVLDDVG